MGDPLISELPATWKSLQDEVARILNECGQVATTDKRLDLVRGSVDIDVWAEDSKRKPAIATAVECKHWSKPVPKTVVHSLKTVLDDSGANVGIIVSKKGFQKGALEASIQTTIKLLDWQAFSGLFLNDWLQNWFYPSLATESDALIEYTEPINSRVFAKADKLSQRRRNRFKALRRKYANLSGLCLFSHGHRLFGYLSPTLPVRKGLTQQDKSFLRDLSDDILDATTLRKFLSSAIAAAKAATSEFDEVFGERA